MFHMNKTDLYIYHSDLYKIKNKQYHLFRIHIFTSQIKIQMYQSNSDSEPLNKQTTP